MKLIKLTVPLAALTLLTSGCAALSGTPSKSLGPAPSVSPARGPALETVWHISSDTVDTAVPHVLGNIVAAQPLLKNELVFIDGTTGRIKGRALRTPELADGAVFTTTDERGRTRIVAADNGSDSKHENVYDPNGRLVWRAPPGAQYAGGYVARQEQVTSGKNAGTEQEVIRTVSGKVVTRLPAGLSGLVNVGFQVVRPGWLALNDGGSPRVTLIDVTRPGHAQVHRLRTPFRTYGNDAAGIKVTAGHDRLYVYLATFSHGTQIAAYRIPHTVPVWHRVVQADAGYPNAGPDVIAYPDPSGGPDTVAVTGGRYGTETVWFLNPDTGAYAGPRAGRSGRLVGASGGRAYIAVEDGNHVPWTRVVDLRTGAVRTIQDGLTGVTTNGYLIGNAGGVTAYRWTN